MLKKDIKSYKNHAWVILGMHRSGTSALSNMLHKMGATAPANLLPPTDENPMGYWESKPLMKTNDSILSDLNSSWSDWRNIDLSNLSEQLQDSLKDRLRVTIDSEFEDLNGALIKDPRFCRFYPILESVLLEEGVFPLPLIVVRNPIEVARSLSARGDVGHAEGAFLWLCHVLAAERSTRDKPRLILAFDELIATPENIAARVLSFQKDYKIKLLGKAKSDEVIAPELRHQQADVKLFEDDPMLSGWILTAFSAMEKLRKSSETQKPELEAFRTLDRISEEMNNAQNIVHAMLSEKYEELTHYKSALGGPPFEEGSLKALIHANEKDLARLKSEIVIFGDKEKKFQDEVDRHLSDKVMLETSYKSTKNQLAEATNFAENQAAQLKSEIIKFGDKEKKFQDEIERHLSEKVNLETSYKSAKDQLAEATSLAKNQSAQIDKIQQDEVRLRKDLEKSLTDKKEKDVKLRNLAKTKVALEKKHQSVLSEVAEKAALIATHEKELDTLSSKVVTLKKDIAKLKREFKKTSSELKAEQESNEGLEESLNKQVEKFNRTEEQNRTFIKRIRMQFDNEIDELRVSKNKSDLRFRADNIALSNKLDTLNAEKSAIETQLQHTKLRHAADADRVKQRSAQLGQILDSSHVKLSVSERVKEKIAVKKINEAGLFDEAYYSNQLKALNLSDPTEPLLHYLRRGYLIGLNPHPLFDSSWYQKTYPDVVESGENPLTHYVRHGDAEDRDPHPLFNTYWFKSNAKVTLKSNVPALTQFLALSVNDLSSPHPSFSVDNYYETYPDVAKAKVNAFTHYKQHGHKEARNPSQTFQEGWYKQRYGSLIPDDMSALEYHLRHGIKNGHLTHPLESRDKRKRSTKAELRKSVLVVAHSASDRIFGAERSLIDVLACIDKERFNVILALPSQNSFYVDAVQAYVDDITFYSREWWDTRKPLKQKNVEFFERLITEKNIDLVYVNTIMLRTPLEVAKRLNIPTVMHIRELIDRDDALIDYIGLPSEQIVTEIGKVADVLVANSSETEALFYESGKCVVVPNAINVAGFGEAPPFSSDGILRVGMLSSNIKKKGIDELHKLAIAAEKENLPALFLAYGPETDDVRRIKNHIKSVGGPSNLIFPGYVQNPADAVKTLDVVVNLSRFAESFGRTAVEAMAAKRPIVGYNHGALKEVIKHQVSGYHIQYLRPEEALIYLKDFIKNPDKMRDMGARGYERAERLYSYTTLSRNINAVMDTALVENLDDPKEVFGVFANAMGDGLDADKEGISTKDRPKVSVVIPNYNYAHYLEERLGSIFEQTYQPTEIIFLDDCSPDNSLEVAKEILERQANGARPIPYRIIPNKKNAGVYKQWLKAVEFASEDWIWIAEADDTSHPRFLETLVDKIESRTSLVYCQSRKIDIDGVEISPNNFAHTNDISPTKWMSDYNENGVFEVVNSLAYRNSIPNTSSAIFRKSAAQGMAKQLTSFRFSGDWFFYAYLLARGDVGYSCQAYNNFRRHEGGVTRQQSKTPAYLIELSRIREYIAQVFPITPKQIARMDWFLNRDYKIEGVEKNTEYPDAQTYLRNAAGFAARRKRIGIITTNNGSYNGGSEMLWQETAIALREAGHDVNVLIKRWLPEPPLFDKLSEAGVKIFFKDDNGFDKLVGQKPDLTIVSIGDQDEGLEFYPRLAREDCPYVIVNQLTKEARFWHIREKKTLPVTIGYRNAERAFFTCWNNHRVMEERLNTALPNGAIHFNPYHIDRNKVPPYPSTKGGYKIAIPSKLLFIHKGQDLLLEVLKQDKWRERDVTFNFYGAGPDRENIASLIEKHDLKNCVIKGRVDDIGDIWKENHASCMPSRMEGLPIMIVSAMLSARPCIATDIGGHAEVITDGSSGFIIPNPDVDDLDRTLEEAYKKRRSWRSMGQQARKDILEFLPENPVDDFVAKLEGLME